MHTMECDRILELLPGRLDGSLEDRRATEVETHLRDCPRCAAEEEALKETLDLLGNLPSIQAPPELLEGIRRKIAAESQPAATGKGLFASARIRIPLEAAAAVLLFLLVYGIQKQLPVTERPVAPPARMETASPHEGIPKDRIDDRKTSETVPAVSSQRNRKAPLVARKPLEARTPMERSAAEPAVALRERVRPRETASATEDRIEAAAGRAASSVPGKEAPMEGMPRTAEAPHAAKSSLPSVPAIRVSTGAESIVPRAREEERLEAPAPFRVFAAPPSRLLRPLPYGREVVLEVAAGERPGLEERIVRVVERFGGSIRWEWHFHGSPSGETDGAPVLEGPMRVQLPADSAEAFLTELRKLGTIPPEGMPASVALPAGPTPDVIAYTVRIRLR